MVKINLISNICILRRAVRHTQAIYNSKYDAPETSLGEPECVTEEEQVDSEKQNLSASLPQFPFVYALSVRPYPSLTAATEE